MANSPHLNMPLLVQGQTGSHAKANTALVTLEAFAVGTLNDFGLNAEPGSPVDGDQYLIGDTATGLNWETHDDEIAVYNGGWTFYAPFEGMRFWIEDENLAFRYDGAFWVEIDGPQLHSVMIQDPSNGDVYPIVKMTGRSGAPGPGTIEMLETVSVRLGGTSVLYTLRYGVDPSAAGTAIHNTAEKTATTGGDSWTDFPADTLNHPTSASWIWVDISSAPSGNPNLWVQVRYWPR